MGNAGRGSRANAPLGHRDRGRAGWRASESYPEDLHLPLRRLADLPRLEDLAGRLSVYVVPVRVLDCTERGVLQALMLAAREARRPLPVPLPTPG